MKEIWKSSTHSMVEELGSPKRLLTTLGIAGGVALAVAALPTWVQAAPAETKKPNILVIWSDDIGMWNVGAYTHGMMGRTPQIDSLAKQGAIITEHYGQASCTAGSAAFITGQMPLRTGESQPMPLMTIPAH